MEQIKAQLELWSVCFVGAEECEKRFVEDAPHCGRSRFARLRFVVVGEKLRNAAHGGNWRQLQVAARIVFIKRTFAHSRCRRFGCVAR